jgi:hypothetical protein
MEPLARSFTPSAEACPKPHLLPDLDDKTGTIIHHILCILIQEQENSTHRQLTNKQDFHPLNIALTRRTSLKVRKNMLKRWGFGSITYYSGSLQNYAEYS